MGHEVFVPFPAEVVRQALTDAPRISRCVPGFQVDTEEAADAPDALAGRLRLHIGHSTITYRGRLRITELDGGGVAVEGHGTETRGDGSVRLELTVRLSAVDGGTMLEWAGTVRRDGRLAEAGETEAAAAGRRLLGRFADGLVADLKASPIAAGETAQATPADSADGGGGEGHVPDRETPEGTAEGAARIHGARGEAGAPGRRERDERDELEKQGDDGTHDPLGGVGERIFPDLDDDNRPVIPGIPSPDKPENREPAKAADTSGSGEESGGEAPAEDERDEGTEAADQPGGAEVPEEEPQSPEAASVVDAEVPSLDPLSDFDDEPESEPPAEAAHARRTMIGRSAEEVDHAPPRGRYAPAPAPDEASAAVALRWAAPAAAALLASAVIISRVLRRRR
jgi:carbon monoxide dehydrogenase subunit G